MEGIGHWKLEAASSFSGIPVRKYVSEKTRLRIVFAEVEGPLVNGYFALATEAHDDDGLPHTLEHLIFLGSEDFPYKGILDLISNRCLSSGTNAWTAVDHTCYTMTCVGSEGFLNMFPIYVDHILFPTLTESGFVTEVHHINGEGEDAGVVYCEMQGRENSSESIVDREFVRNAFPGKCGYKSETGGIMKNLRESTTHKKVVDYHKDFYRAENLCLIITGSIDEEKVFESLSTIEEKVMAKNRRLPAFTRPWQSPVPPVEKDVDLKIPFPADEEDNGMIQMGWRGPSIVENVEKYYAITVLMEYLTESSVSPLKSKFVETTDPLASDVSFHLTEQMDSVTTLHFDNVPLTKISNVKNLLLSTLNDIVVSGFDMTRMKVVIERRISELMANAETKPHHTIPELVIPDLLYGQSEKDFEARCNMQKFFEKLQQMSNEFWTSLLQELLKKPLITVIGVPSIEMQEKIANDEKARIEKQRTDLKEKGLKERAKILDDAIEFNEKPAPVEIFDDFGIPSIDSISFHASHLWGSNCKNSKRNDIDLQELNFPTTFCDVHSNFAYLCVVLDTSEVSKELRPFLPLLTEVLFESAIKTHDGTVIPYEDVVQKLDADVIARTASLGVKGRRFRTGTFGNCLFIMLQVERKKYARGVQWLDDILFRTQYTPDRVLPIVSKIENGIAEMKRNGPVVLQSAKELLNFSESSNHFWNVFITQQPFLKKLQELLMGDDASKISVVDQIHKLRKELLTRCSIFVGTHFSQIEDPLSPWKKTLFQSIKALNPPKPFLPDNQELQFKSKHLAIGIGAVDSSFLLRVTPGITSYNDPDLAPLMTFFQYQTQLEGPMWRKIRGVGLSYGYGLKVNVDEGTIVFMLFKSTHPVKAFTTTKDLLLTASSPDFQFSKHELDAAKSSLIFELVEGYASISGVVSNKMLEVMRSQEDDWLKKFLRSIHSVTENDLKRVSQKYATKLFDEPNINQTIIVCHPSKSEDIKNDFNAMNVPLEVCKSVESSASTLVDSDVMTELCQCISPK